MSERIQSPVVASMIGVTSKTVREMAERGKIPTAARFGTRWTFDREAIKLWVKRKEGEACLDTSTDEEESGGGASSPPDATIDEAYEREIRPKQRSASKRGLKR